MPALPPPSLPTVEESFENVIDLYTQGRYAETLPYCEVAMAAGPNSTQLMVESAKCYEAAGQPEWTQMLRQMAENLASKRSDVPQGTDPAQEQIPRATPIPPIPPPPASAEPSQPAVVPATPEPEVYHTGETLGDISLPFAEDFSDPNSGWLVWSDEKLYNLGGSVKDAADKTYFTIAPMDSCDANLQQILVHIDNGIELFGPNALAHP